MAKKSKDLTLQELVTSMEKLTTKEQKQLMAAIKIILQDKINSAKDELEEIGELE